MAHPGYHASFLEKRTAQFCKTKPNRQNKPKSAEQSQIGRTKPKLEARTKVNPSLALRTKVNPSLELRTKVNPSGGGASGPPYMTFAT
jgi:hypothetical protein